MTPLSIFAAVTVLCTVLDIHVVQYSTVLYSTVLYSTVQYCTVLYYVQYCSTAIWHYLPPPDIGQRHRGAFVFALLAKC